MAIWADPSQPSRYPATAYAILTAYLVVAALHATMTWNNWWLENAIARVAHLVDILLFGVMVFLTDGYTSPFFTFSVFIILSATIKWSERETAQAAAAVIILFFAVGFAAIQWGSASFEITRLMVRGTYLMVLSLILVWFAINQRSVRWRSARGPGLDPLTDAGLPIAAGLHYVAERIGAGRVALIWWHEDEPWLHLALRDHGAVIEERHRPDRFGDLVNNALAGSIFLFDRGRQRALVCEAGVIVRRHMAQALDPELAARLDRDKGLVIPIEAEPYCGMFIAMDVPGLCADDARIGEQLGREFSAALRRASMLGLAEQEAVSRTRLALARDLHDSIVQLLTGTALRLEGIRQSACSGRPIEAEIEALQTELATEQGGLRSLIGQLRDGSTGLGSKPLHESLEALLERSSRQWNVRCDLSRCPPELVVAAEIEHQLNQLVREAVANAARHGGATVVSVAVDSADSGLTLTIADDGNGFPVGEQVDEGSEANPWSLNERARELGGSLSLASSGAGSTVTILLPWRAR